MNIGIIGSGIVGQTLGTALAAGGHAVVLGTREPAQLDARKGLAGSLAEWLERSGSSASVDTFTAAARHGDAVINATAGTVSLDALRLAGASALEGRVLLDVSNPLDFSGGMPPTLTVCNTDSIGERIQRAFPGTRVVKTLNTLTAALMVRPTVVAGGDHHIFVSGDDADARRQVARWLHDWFGWPAESVIDLGDITTARGTEMWLPLWVRLWQALGTPMFNLRLVR